MCIFLLYPLPEFLGIFLVPWNSTWFSAEMFSVTLMLMLLNLQTHSKGTAFLQWCRSSALWARAGSPPRVLREEILQLLSSFCPYIFNLWMQSWMEFFSWVHFQVASLCFCKCKAEGHRDGSEDKGVCYARLGLSPWVPWWKKRTQFRKLFSDLHKPLVALSHPHQYNTQKHT